MPMKIVKAIVILLLLLLPVVCASAESVNTLAAGECRMEVRFLDCAKKSDGSLVLVRTEEGTQIVVVDGGIANARCYSELNNLRKEWMTDAGLAEQTKNADWQLHITLVVTHCHKDHVAELYSNIIPAKYLTVDALHLCEESVLPAEYADHESKNRVPLLNAMKNYAGDAPIYTVPFGETREIPLTYGTAKLFAPLVDFGAEEGRAFLTSVYYPTDTPKQLLADLATAVVNGNSLFLRVETPGASVLFPGDCMKKKAGRSDEPLDQMIAYYGEALRADIVKYPHHGIKRGAAALCLKRSLVKEGGISVLTGPDAWNDGGIELDKLEMPWVDTRKGEQVFILNDTGWECLTMEE